MAKPYISCTIVAARRRMAIIRLCAGMWRGSERLFDLAAFTLTGASSLFLTRSDFACSERGLNAFV